MKLSPAEVGELRAALWERAHRLATAGVAAPDQEEVLRRSRHISELVLLRARLGEALEAHPEGLEVEVARKGEPT